MFGKSIPSQYILQKAWKLGQKMASTERRIAPVTSDACRFPGYELFREVHRLTMEELSSFPPWDAKIHALIEREGRSIGAPLDNPRVWDAFYTRVASRIRSVFWQGWEHVHQLEALYNQEVERGRMPSASPHVLHVYTAPRDAEAVVSTLPDELDEGIWAAVATRVFDEMKTDDNEDFWKMPDANLIAAASIDRENRQSHAA